MLYGDHAGRVCAAPEESVDQAMVWADNAAMRRKTMGGRAQVELAK
jgi:hypothetical protein